MADLDRAPSSALTPATPHTPVDPDSDGEKDHPTLLREGLTGLRDHPSRRCSDEDDPAEAGSVSLVTIRVTSLDVSSQEDQRSTPPVLVSENVGGGAGASLPVESE